MNAEPNNIAGIDDVEYLASLDHVRMKGYNEATQKAVYIWFTLKEFEDFEKKIDNVKQDIEEADLT